MNAQRIKQLEKLQALAQEIENTLDDIWEDVDNSIDNLEFNEMEHLPAYDTLQVDRDNLNEAREAVADLYQALDACIDG